jgi:hypothetical protein
MIIGEHAREGDLEVNPTKLKVKKKKNFQLEIFFFSAGFEQHAYCQ